MGNKDKNCTVAGHNNEKLGAHKGYVGYSQNRINKVNLVSRFQYFKFNLKVYETLPN